MSNGEQTFEWRLKVVERAVDHLQMYKADEKDLEDIKKEFKSLRTALIIFSLSCIGTAVMFLVGVLALVTQG